MFLQAIRLTKNLCPATSCIKRLQMFEKVFSFDHLTQVSTVTKLQCTWFCSTCDIGLLKSNNIVADPLFDLSLRRSEVSRRPQNSVCYWLIGRTELYYDDVLQNWVSKKYFSNISSLDRWIQKKDNCTPKLCACRTWHKTIFFQNRTKTVHFVISN